MKPRIFQVDAFTTDPFRGNPAGVCLLSEAAPDSWMQGIAAEMNVSETAFVLPRAGGYSLRYFTPSVEVELCGHATLSSAHILWEEGIVSPGETIHFSAKGGDLRAAREEDWIRLDFPALPDRAAEIPAGLGDALGARPVTGSRLPEYGYLVEIEAEDAVQSMRPDFARLRSGGYGMIIVTARSAVPAFDFVSRFFAPEIGIDEDPVTGIAHCALGPYWSAKLGKRELVGHQVSKRGGIVRVRVRGDRVDLLGKALTVFRGEIAVAV